MGIELAVGAGIGAISAGVSAAAASAQNRAIQQSMNVNAENARIKQADMVRRRELLANQAMDQRRMAQLQEIRRANAVEGRARATAAMGGRSTSFGSAARAVETINADRLFNQMVIDRNLQGQLMQVNSQYQTGVSDNLSAFNAMMAQLNAQAANPILSTIQGGISGFGTGIQIGSAFK